MFGHGLWCCPSSVGCLWCSWLGFGFDLLLGRVWFRGRPSCPPPFPVPACGVGVCAGPGSRLCPALLCWVVRVCFLRFGFFFFRVPFPRGPLFLAWCGRFWVGGPPVPLWGSFFFSVPSGGGPGRLWWCWRAVWRLWAVFVPFPPPPSLFWGGGGACLFLPLPSLGWRTHWPAFSVVFRAAVFSCVLCGRVPAPWVGWALYTVGSAPLLAGLGPGSAGWGAAPGGCLWFWVSGLGLFVSFPLCGAGCNLLGGPPPLSRRWHVQGKQHKRKKEKLKVEEAPPKGAGKRRRSRLPSCSHQPDPVKRMRVPSMCAATGQSFFSVCPTLGWVCENFRLGGFHVG